MMRMNTMINPIDINKLPIKYVIRSYILLENYPTSIDILFDLASDISIIEGLQFDFNYARYILSTKVSKQISFGRMKIMQSKFIARSLLNKSLITSMIIRCEQV